MRERSPFSLYKRKGIRHARFWDEQLQSYAVTNSTKSTNRNRAEITAGKMLEEGRVRRRAAAVPVDVLTCSLSHAIEAIVFLQKRDLTQETG